MTAEADYRLPRNVTPRHYAVTLTPDLAAATFTGSAVVDVEVNEQTSNVVLNAVELDVVSAALTADGHRIAATPHLDEERERLVLSPATPLAEGEWQLHLEFSGVLNDQLRGFYRSRYEDDAGVEHVLATTQFEATDARRAFPCWDEPDLKATFDIALLVPEGIAAISCGPVISDEPIGGGLRRVQFATTMSLSTYLLAFVVGDLEATDPVDVDGTPLRIVHVPGKGHLTDFALEFGAFALRFFTDYYGIPYPGDKLDLLAIPDFASGAMENLGAVTFRESLLLIDPAAANQAELQRVADVIAHELAHMWFGDLVTMRWWNGLWLKEAFATFMEMTCVDAFKPEWRRWSSFAAERDRSMDTDALASTRPIEFEVASPSDADAMYDVITYEKGAAVLRMLQQYLGEEPFRRGINRYLRTHAHGNTETHDLWDALEAESGEPVRDIMDSWIFQGGHPQIEVTPALDGYMLRQKRFRFIGESGERWRVPVLYQREAGLERAVLDEELVVPGDTPPLVNRGGSGYYRTRYTGDVLDRVATDIGVLPAEDRFVIVADTWANTLAGDTPAAEFLELVGAMPGERDVGVWGAMLGGIAELNRVVTSDERPALEAFVRGLVGPTAQGLSWSPTADESDLERKLRGELLTALGALGSDPATISAARQLFPAVLDGSAELDGEVASAAVSIVASHGDGADHARFVKAYATSTNPQDKLRYLRAMAAIPDSAAAIETLEMVLDGRIRSQNSMLVAARLLANRVAGPDVWAAVKQHWIALIGLMPPFSARNVIATLHLRSEPDLAADIREWLPAHPLPGGDTLVAQQLERLDVRVRLREREGHMSVPTLG
ncbi:MAG TPA: M1 family metallopeptidase [Acidimicrobiia bacterium]|jgi:puromycin-sensitive aminopeptidase|nr:M1 family metallopeptidase [Acidimicrobiia bacterium]